MWILKFLFSSSALLNNFPIRKYKDFALFINNLLRPIHSSTFINSLFTITFNSFISLCAKHKYVSSAYSLVLNEEHLGRSFTYMIKNNGTSVESCGTPHLILKFPIKESFSHVSHRCLMCNNETWNFQAVDYDSAKNGNVQLELSSVDGVDNFNEDPYTFFVFDAATGDLRLNLTRTDSSLFVGQHYLLLKVNAVWLLNDFTCIAILSLISILRFTLLIYELCGVHRESETKVCFSVVCRRAI